MRDEKPESDVLGGQVNVFFHPYSSARWYGRKKIRYHEYDKSKVARNYKSYQISKDKKCYPTLSVTEIQVKKGID